MLSHASRVEVYNIGGTVSPVTRAEACDWAVDEMERLHVDVSVVCPAGVCMERGPTEATPVAAVGRALLAAGDKVIALADADSFGGSAFLRFASLDQIDVIAVAGLTRPSHDSSDVERGITITTGGTL